MVSSQPFALTLRASRQDGYDHAETLGFDMVSESLAVSVFNDGPDRVHVQALYASYEEAHAAKTSLPLTVEASVAQLSDTDWVGLSQSGLSPVSAGRFLIHGSHDTSGDAPIPILVDAGQAFGTGHHGTTLGCLHMLDQLERDGASPMSILDLGTGAGILAIAAAKLFPDASVLATDIDPVAVEVALSNAELNATSFNIVVADGFDAQELSGQQFDLVIANILAGPLRELAPEIEAATAPGGTVILSGILDAQSVWVADAFRTTGLSVTPQASRDGWTSILAHKA